ncbi:MAG: YebC/PmpR family DNA-binding transcriptional regulator [Chitinophagales bacterium]
MSGHNKWSKIKRKKGVADAKRGKEFTRVIKEITVAVKEGGSSDPEMNPRLRLAIANAKGINMPKENTERAIKKAEESGGAGYEELTYEAYAPGGIAVFVEVATDNTNRTVSNLRSLFSKSGGSLATSGSVAFLFERKGVFEFLLGNYSEDELMLDLIDAGAEDVEVDEDYVTLTCAFEDFGNVQDKLEKMNIEVKKAGVEYIPKTTTALELNEAKKVLRLIEKLEDDDDVQSVYHNLELSDELIAELEQ